MRGNKDDHQALSGQYRSEDHGDKQIPKQPTMHPSHPEISQIHHSRTTHIDIETGGLSDSRVQEISPHSSNEFKHERHADLHVDTGSYESDAERLLRERYASLRAEHGLSLLEQAMSTRNFTLLDNAIDALRGAVKYLPEKHVDMPGLLSNLGAALQERFVRRGDIRDLEQAILLRSQAVDLLNSSKSPLFNNSGILPSLLTNLGATFEMRFQRLGQIDDLEQAISLKSRSVDLTPDDHPSMPNRLSNLGNALETRFDRLGKTGDLERAIAMKTRSVDLAPDSDPSMPNWLSNLGSALETRFERFGNMDDLERAISLRTRSVTLTPDNHPLLPLLLHSLGGDFELRFDRSGEIKDLDQAISFKTRSVALSSDSHFSMPGRLDGLGVALEKRFYHLGNIGDLEEAITLKSRSIALTPDDHPRMPGSLNNIGNAFETYFDRLGRVDDLEKAISFKKRSVILTPDDHPALPARLSSLGNAFEKRFNRLDKISDLEQAISFKIRSVDLTPDDNPHILNLLGNLGSAFWSRFERLGEVGDLEQAIAVTTRAVDLLPDNHPGMPALLVNLGNLIVTRFYRSGKSSDLERAVFLHSRALDLTPINHSDMPIQLANLGATYHTRFRHLKGIGDLEQAISLRSRSVDITPSEHPNMPMRLNSLAVSLKARFSRLEKIEDLEGAILHRRRAIDLLPKNNPILPMYLHTLAEDVQTSFTAAGYSGICPEAVSHLQMAITCNTGLPRYRLHAVAALASLYWHSNPSGSTPSHDKLVETYEHAFDLIPEVVWLGSTITRRYELLSSIGDIANGAAAAAIAAGKFTRAIEWMEQARGVVWGQLLQLRSPIDDLFKRHPDLAQQLQSVSLQLERAANVTGKMSKGDSDYSFQTGSSKEGTTIRNESATRIRLAQEYQELLSDIRKREGFSRFLMPKIFADFASACNGGPIILINVYESRCDTLVWLSADQIVHVPLHNINYRFAKAMLHQFVSSLRESGLRERSGLDNFGDEASSFGPRQRHRGVDSQADSSESIATVLYALWRYVVVPVLPVVLGKPTDTVLAANNLELQHVTWIAGGPLAFLPIHAAGEYGSTSEGKVFDLVVSSYTPTLSSLLRPHKFSASSRSSHPKVLAVSQPGISTHSPLPGALVEIDKLKKRFPGTEMIHLSDSQATIGTVLQAMDEHQCPYIHLACHGMQHPTDPTKSAFVLYDGNLELTQLISKSADNATLAFLSACQTATGDAKLTEESVHLAAGMLSVGYRGVVGTLWSIHDDDAPLVADEFYRALNEREDRAAEEGADRSQIHAAYALHGAIKTLRKSVGESNILRWAPYVHFGL